jgi:hypothetical protein
MGEALVSPRGRIGVPSLRGLDDRVEIIVHGHTLRPRSLLSCPCHCSSRPEGASGVAFCPRATIPKELLMRWRMTETKTLEGRWDNIKNHAIHNSGWTKELIAGERAEITLAWILTRILTQTANCNVRTCARRSLLYHTRDVVARRL